MSTTVEALAAQAIHLSAEDRTHLADLLLASLPEGTDDQVDAAWDLEIERRVEAVNAGTAQLVSSEDVHAAARQIYQR
jgi:putative addiction module component (TIGR02574 family)